MTISQIKTISFAVYGDGTTTNYVVDLAEYFPCGFSVLYVYVSSQVNVPYWGNYPQSTELTYTMSGTIMSVTLPSAPLAWVPPSVPDNLPPNPNSPPAVISTPPAVTFTVTASY